MSANSGAPSATAASTVNYLNACLSPTNFSAVSQPVPEPDSFSGDDIIVELTAFTITPSNC